MGQQRAPQGGLTRRRAKGPRGGPLLAAALACVSAGRVAPEVDGCLACQVGGRDWPQGTLSADGAVADARHLTCSRLRATWQAAVGQRADEVGGRLQCSWRRARLWLAGREAGSGAATCLPQMAAQVLLLISQPRMILIALMGVDQ